MREWSEDDKDGTVSVDEIRVHISNLESEKIALENRLADLETQLHLPSKESGPLVESFEAGLQRHGIKRQKYHGKCFVGNDVHKFLKPEVHCDVLDGMVEKCKTLTGDPEIIESMEMIADKYKGALGRFNNVHLATSHKCHVPRTDLPMVKEVIDDFLAYYRSEFPNSSIPIKYHLLEDHVIPWMERFPFGLGLLGEQGAESVHAAVNRNKGNFSSMRSDNARLQCIMQEHQLKCTPDLKPYMPEPKRYKKEVPKQ